MGLFHKHQWVTTKRSSMPIYEQENVYNPNFQKGQAAVKKPIGYVWAVYQVCRFCGKEVIRRTR